jgi:hypothetical protein
MIIPLTLVLFNLFLLIFPSEVLAAARGGLLLWFNNVLPPLLPAMVGVSLLLRTPLARLGPVMALLAGFPMGAKMAGELYRDNLLTAKQARNMAAWANSAGPVFIVAAVGVGMFGSARVGYVLLAANTLAALVLWLALRGRDKPPAIAPLAPISFGEAVKTSMEALVVVGGTIIFASVAAAVLAQVGLGGAHGLLEMTGGIRGLAEGGSPYAIPLAAFFLGFGGAAIHAQSLHFLRVPPLPYLAAKLAHGLLAATFAFLISFASQPV